MEAKNVCVTVDLIEEYIENNLADSMNNVEGFVNTVRSIVAELEDVYLSFECGDSVIHVVET